MVKLNDAYIQVYFNQNEIYLFSKDKKELIIIINNDKDKISDLNNMMNF